MKEPTQNESLLAAIDDHLEGMSRIDLILNVKVFREARDRVVKERDQLRRELAEAHTSHGKTLLSCEETISRLKSELIKAKEEIETCQQYRESAKRLTEDNELRKVKYD